MTNKPLMITNEIIDNLGKDLIHPHYHKYHARNVCDTSLRLWIRITFNKLESELMPN